MKVQQLASAETKAAVGAFAGVGDILVRPRTTAPDAIGVVVHVTGDTFTSATFQVEWSQDGTNFFAADAADAFTAITAAGGLAKSFAVKGRFFRLRLSALTGTNVIVTSSAVTG